MVVGAGVGGAAVAHWLRELYGDDLDLTVVSDGPVGGRAQNIDLDDGRQYEGGAAILSDLNEYMKGFMRRLRLEEKCTKHLDVPLGVFDGARLLVREADPTRAPLGLKFLAGLQSAWRLMSRYGVRNLLRLKGLMTHPASPKFPRLYRMLEEGKAFETPESLLDALGPQCTALTGCRALEWLTDPPPSGGGLPRSVVDELVTGGMHSNYGGQGCEMLHAFVALVSIAGGFASRCFSAHGGWQQVPRGLLELARPQQLYLGATARAVRRVDAGGGEAWEVDVAHGAPGEAMKGERPPAPPEGTLRTEGPFDVVILAHPLERSCVQLEGPPAASAPEDDHAPRGRFRRCVTHYLRGVLRRKYFYPDSGPGAHAGWPPPAVLTAAGSTAPFYSIGLQTPVDVRSKREATEILDGALTGKPSVFKVFAPEVLTDAQLDEIFEQRGSAKVNDWFAYPEYTVPQPLRPFVLDPGGGSRGPLLYLNAVEQAASAMEMSAVSARNAANLVVGFVDRRRGGAEGGDL